MRGRSPFRRVLNALIRSAGVRAAMQLGEMSSPAALWRFIGQAPAARAWRDEFNGRRDREVLRGLANNGEQRGSALMTVSTRALSQLCCAQVRRIPGAY